MLVKVPYFVYFVSIWYNLFILYSADVTGFREKLTIPIVCVLANFFLNIKSDNLRCLVLVMFLVRLYVFQ